MYYVHSMYIIYSYIYYAVIYKLDKKMRKEMQ